MRPPPGSRALHPFAVCTAAAAFLLLVAGGLVTSTDSGLAVPDWPLSYGMWFPPMVGGIRYEHGHRMLAAVVGGLILVMAVWLRLAEPRRWVRRLGDAALGGVIAQALLGGLTVRFLLPPAVSIAHACLGPAVFCLVVALAHATSPAWEGSPRSAATRPQPAVRALSLGAATLAGAQLVLGALVRHTGAFLWWHVAGACALAITVGWLVIRAHRAKDLPPLVRRGVWRLGALIALQLLLGSLTFWHWGHVGLVTAHTALGALILAQAVLLAWHALRLTRSGRHVWRKVTGTFWALLELTKPRLTALVLVTTAAGFWMGWRPESGGVERILPLLLGVGLVVGGANALNQWMERELDGRMQRTRSRPLPSGRLQPEAARRFGLALIAVGLLLLAAVVNGLSAALAGVSAASYLFLYTPMKRTSPLCTLIGAIPGALPPTIGWVGAQGTVGAGGWVLFTILFVWQLPHFLAIAWMYREDFARAAFRFLPVVDPSGSSTSRQILWSATALVPLSLLPTVTGVAGPAYFYGALLLGGGLLVVSAAAAVRRSAASARRLFLATVAYLPLLLLLLSADKVSHAAPGPPVFRTVPAFALTDHTGRPVTRETLRDSVWIADFIFTRCAGQCPLMSRRMAALQDAFAESPGVRLVSFTVDPDYDTPSRLAAYARTYGARDEQWMFVTGPREALFGLARDGFRLSVADGGPPEEPITHSVRLALVDQVGRIRGTYDATDPAALRALEADVRTLVARP